MILDAAYILGVHEDEIRPDDGLGPKQGGGVGGVPVVEVKDGTGHAQLHAVEGADGQFLADGAQQAGGLAGGAHGLRRALCRFCGGGDGCFHDLIIVFMPTGRRLNIIAI